MLEKRRKIKNIIKMIINLKMINLSKTYKNNT